MDDWSHPAGRACRSRLLLLLWIPAVAEPTIERSNYVWSCLFDTGVSVFYYWYIFSLLKCVGSWKLEVGTRNIIEKRKIQHPSGTAQCMTSHEKWRQIGWLFSREWIGCWMWMCFCFQLQNDDEPYNNQVTSAFNRPVTPPYDPPIVPPSSKRSSRRTSRSERQRHDGNGLERNDWVVRSCAVDSWVSTVKWRFSWERCRYPVQWWRLRLRLRLRQKEADADAYQKKMGLGRYIKHRSVHNKINGLVFRLDSTEISATTILQRCFS